MSVLKCKGTKLQSEVATVLTNVAQLLSLDGPDSEVETFEADTLDNDDAGIPMKPTGRVAGGSLSFELFLDPALAGHKALLAKITTPVSDSYSLVFSDATAWPFEGVFISLSPTVDLADGLKASGEVELDGMVDYPA